jgi:hypothetical protein
MREQRLTYAYGLQLTGRYEMTYRTDGKITYTESPRECADEMLAQFGRAEALRIAKDTVTTIYDSRRPFWADVMALLSPQAPWTYGWNAPGYMPDCEPTECETWGEARDGLLWEIERWESFDPEAMEAEHAKADAVVAELKAATAGEEFTSGLFMGVVCWIAKAI